MSKTTNIVLAGHKIGIYTAKTNQKILSHTLVIRCQKTEGKIADMWLKSLYFSKFCKCPSAKSGIFSSSKAI
jgi:hypothetical protein